RSLRMAPPSSTPFGAVRCPRSESPGGVIFRRLPLRGDIDAEGRWRSLSHVIKAAVLQGEGCRDTGRGASSWSTLVRGAINRLRASAPPDTAVVIIPVCLGAAVVFGLALVHGATMLAGPPIALLAAATLAEALPVPIEGVAAGATSFSNVFIAASATPYGWKVAAVVGVL